MARYPKLKAPFPYFGGKSKAAPLIWSRLGNPANYVEPFFGSGATFLLRPEGHRGIETVNDIDGYLANFWRSIKHDPESVADHAVDIVSEVDLHARHLYLVKHREELTARLQGDPEWYDPKIAGWWVWGLCNWIGGGFCSGRGSWTEVDGVFMKKSEALAMLNGDTTDPENTDDQATVVRQMPHLGAPRGVQRDVVNLEGIVRQMPHLGPPQGVQRTVTGIEQLAGVHRKMPDFSNTSRGIMGRRREAVLAWFLTLQSRFAHTRVGCGSWDRWLGPSITTRFGMTAIVMDPPRPDHDLDFEIAHPEVAEDKIGILLDPPYMETAEDEGEDQSRAMGIYAFDSGDIAQQVQDWCAENGSNPLLRIALCGYDGEHNKLEELGWEKVEWVAGSGYSKGDNLNRHREVIFFSPACLKPTDRISLFDLGDEGLDPELGTVFAEGTVAGMSDFAGMEKGFLGFHNETFTGMPDAILEGAEPEEATK